MASTDISPAEALHPTSLIDADHEDIQAFARLHGDLADPVRRAVALYLAVRDGFRYDPYRVDLSPEGLKASRVLADGHGWCVTKAALLTAVWRAAGLPAIVGYADVRNHLSTERLRAVIGTNDYVWHGYACVYLHRHWVKATPAFNASLCSRLGIDVLAFDGRRDSIYQAYDSQGRRHMEYVRMRGEYLDVPLAEIRADFERCYPGLLRLNQSDFDADIVPASSRPRA